jgi:hypothetical protein
LKFLIDAMFSPDVGMNLETMGHDAISIVSWTRQPADVELLTMAASEGRVVVTENFRHFARATACPVLLIQKDWWPRGPFHLRLATALNRWAAANPDPGNYARWLDAEFR